MSATEKMEMVKFTARQLFFSRKTSMLMILSFFPLVIVLAWMYQPGEQSSSSFFFGVFISVFLQFILLIITLLYGTALLNSEIANKTISYLVTRSLRREEIFLYRYLGSIPVGFFVIAIPVSICLVILDIYSGNSFTNLEYLPGYYAVILLGIAIYSSFFTFLGVTIKRPLMVGLLFAFFWEILLANLPGKIPYMTIMFYLRSSSHHITDGVWPDYYIEALSSTVSVVVLLSVTVVFIFIGILKFRNKNLIE